jgi:hypothetical protein
MPPPLVQDINMFKFVNLMQSHLLDVEATFNCPYSEFEVVTNNMQHTVEDERYEIMAQTAKATLQNVMNQKSGYRPR